jgi:hypothetical protein
LRIGPRNKGEFLSAYSMCLGGFGFYYLGLFYKCVLKILFSRKE